MKGVTLTFLDLDAVYFEQARYNSERGWHNFSLSKGAVVELLENPGWYELSIPPEDLQFGSGDPMRRVLA
jgi:hypothetical protein